MGSSYFGEPNMGGGGGGGGSSSSSRKGKKSNSDKPKQPQRGLGVAQLEKIRLHGQMGSTYHPSLHSPYSTSFSNMGGLGEYERANMTYGGEHNSQLSTTARWDVPGNAILDTQHFVQSSMTRHLLNPPPVEDSHHRTSKKHRSSSLGSSSHNSESSDTQDLDLELRL
ncbi:protein SPEAR1 isoform X3 [Pyrus x bretschneideri]|uniref:protein SPEAR1 isoform X3 n=1 Tax=Pyrus x bretschneideri TaxID=225117 RepID=UPI00202ECDAD|nr:protein SPEAR1 isoform X3 [Pyrus x bretschneideri]